MKYIVNAHHHGAFLTIRQLTEWDLDFVVMVPQSQVDKYSTMEGAEFKNFLSNIKKASKKKPVVIYTDANWVLGANRILEERGETGMWMALQAGSLLLGYGAKFKTATRFGMVPKRVHPKFKRLYVMLGEKEVDDTVYTNVFFINMDVNKPGVSKVDSNLIMRPDVLYGRSFGTTWCVRYREMTRESLAMSFWMELIRRDDVRGEIVAYPFNIYGEYAKPVKKYLPQETYDLIQERSIETAWTQDFVELGV